MVVLAASVLSKPGKVVLSRQFVSITRGRLESLLANFPKLIASDSSGKQHTFIETDDVRYVYQPLEQLYLVLVTTRQSNILEDLETLRLLSQLIPEYCGGNTENDVRQNAFELIMAFDEAVSLGFQENVTLSQVKTFIEMDSHEERLSEIIQKGKENEARDEMRRRAEIIARQKEQAKKSDGGKNFGGHGVGPDRDEYKEPKVEVQQKKAKKEKKKNKDKEQDVASGSSSGMQLGVKPKQKDDFFNALSKEEKFTAAPVNLVGDEEVEVGEEDGDEAGGDMNPVSVSCIEKLSIELDKEGGIKQLVLVGELRLTVHDPEWARIKMKLSGDIGKEFKSRLHPKVNPREFKKNNVVILSDPSRPFPTGTDNSPVILKWKMQTEDEDQLPFTVNFWANPEDDNTAVDCTIDLVKEDLVLENIVLTIPCPSEDAPEVGEKDGEFHYQPRKKQLIWTIPELSKKNPKASLEFSCDARPEELYPLKFDFESSTTYSGLRVESIEKTTDNTPLEEIVQRTQIVVSKFQVSGDE